MSDDVDPSAKPSPPKGRPPSSPTTRHERSNITLDRHLNAQRHLAECRFSKLKQILRRVGTRF